MTSRAQLRGAWRPRAARTAFALAASLALSFGCRRSSSKENAAPPAPAESFAFSEPREDEPIELRGEGSETLRAPPGARAEERPDGVRVSAGNEFVLDVRFHALAPGALEPRRAASQLVLQQGDALVFKTARGYWFVVTRELVPEWDENDRRQVTCSSAGALPSAPSAGEARSGETQRAMKTQRSAGGGPNADEARSSAGQRSATQELRTFSRAAVEHMVAACRTLELPHLQ